MQRLKVLYIDIEGGFGGSSRSLLNMVADLDRKLFEPIVICKKNGPTFVKLQSLGIQTFIDCKIFSIIPLKKNNLKNWLIHGYKLFLMKSVLNKIINIKPDILHLNYEGLIPLHYFLSKRNLKIKTILHFRSSVAKANFIYKIYAKHINKHINHLIFITENQYEEAKKSGVLVDNISNTILYNASNILGRSKIKEAKKGSFKKLKIIYMGSLDISRGVLRLIELAKEFKRLKLPITLSLYGQSSFIRRYFCFKVNLKTYLSYKIKRLLLQDVIKIHNFTSKPEEELLKADLLIHPSKNNDPWGRNIIEAMSLGLPVITHGKYDKFIKNNSTGILLKEWSLSNYVESIKFISSNKNLLNKWSTNSLSFAEKNFNKKKYSTKIKNIYLTLHKIK